MQALIESLGGIGLFLYGMTAMTSGLRKLAGDRLRRSLARWTSNPFSGAMVGTAATAVLQSSSATTVAAVGFVGAGLLTFEQTLGIIFGALDISAAATPLIAIETDTIASLQPMMVAVTIFPVPI